MADSKFLIVTTLCYVGIFGVIFIVCCCAWTRHFRKASRGLSSRPRNAQTNRRFYRPTAGTQQPPDYNVPSTPMPYGSPRGNEVAIEIQNVTDGNTYFTAAQRPNPIGERNNLYPMVGRYPNPMFTAGYPRGHFYPTGVTTGTHAVEITNYGDIKDEGFSAGDDFSDATSSRFDGGDSTLADTDDKASALITRTRSRSLESEKQVAESDVSSSQASHLQDIALREEQC